MKPEPFMEAAKAKFKAGTHSLFRFEMRTPGKIGGTCAASMPLTERQRKRFMNLWVAFIKEESLSVKVR
jgi:hypothetical protein